MIIVFGGEGQLGRELQRRAAVKDIDLAALSRGAADVADASAVARSLSARPATIVVNAAAYTNVDRAEAEPEAARRVNAAGAANVAAAAAAAGLPLIHVSTDFVFDGGATAPYREDDPVAPLSVYGRTKAEGEANVRGLCPQHLILRTAWLYSATGSGFLQAILRAVAERDRLDVVTDQRGSPTAAPDLADAVLVAARAIGEGASSWGTYHVAGAGAATRFEFAEAIVAAQARFTGRAPRVNPILTQRAPGHAVRPANAVLDSTKFARTFGYAARPWRRAVDETIAEIFDGR